MSKVHYLSTVMSMHSMCCPSSNIISNITHLMNRKICDILHCLWSNMKRVHILCNYSMWFSEVWDADYRSSLLICGSETATPRVVHVSTALWGMAFGLIWPFSMLTLLLSYLISKCVFVLLLVHVYFCWSN